jgi:hypothetical protein
MESQFREHKLDQDDGLSEFERVKKDEEEFLKQVNIASIQDIDANNKKVT